MGGATVLGTGGAADIVPIAIASSSSSSHSLPPAGFPVSSSVVCVVCGCGFFQQDD